MSTSSNLIKALGALRQDGWKATLSGLGGPRDKGRASNVRFCPSVYLDRATLAAAYRDNWLVRRIVNAVPEEAMRRGFGEGLETPEFDRLNYERFAEGALLRAACLGRLMGGAGVYVGYRDGGADLTLPPAPGAEVSFLEVFHRYELTAVEWSRVKDPSDPTYGQPMQWQVTGQNRTGLVFHESRMIKFPGQPRADDFEFTAAVDRDWWDSILQSVWEDAQRYGVFWQAVSHLMQISSVGVLSISGLIDMLASQNQADAEARIDLLNEALSLTRLLLLDSGKNESYKREAVSFADVPGLLQELQLATAGAVGMPVTTLFGRAPAGMNATGESDVRGWYDAVDTWRERVLKPRAEELIGRCERSESVEIEWPPLWEPTEKECAEVRQTKVATAQTLWTMGVASESEIRKSLYEQKPLEEMLVGEPPEPPEPPEPQLTPDPFGGGGEPADPVARARRVLGDALHEDAEIDPGVAKARQSLRELVEAADELAKRREVAAKAFEDFKARSESTLASARDEAEAARDALEEGTETAADRLKVYKANKAYEQTQADLNAEKTTLKTAEKEAKAAERKHTRAVDKGLNGLDDAYSEHLDKAYAELAEAEEAYQAAPSIDELQENATVAERLANHKATKAAREAHVRVERAKAVVAEVEADIEEVHQAKVGWRAGDDMAKAIVQGPRGGRYYLSAGGSKTYVKATLDEAGAPRLDSLTDLDLTRLADELEERVRSL